MKPLLNMRGIITVLNTPFTADDQIDLPSLRVNVSNAIDAGVAGCLVPAMASEVGKLSEQERLALVDATLEEVHGRVPVIGGASAPTSEERVRTARQLVKAGCDGVLVSIPYEDEESYTRAVLDVAETAPPFLMVQDWDASGYGVPVATVARLFEEVEPFRALKVEVVPAGRKYTEVLEATGGRLHISGGWAVMQMIEAMDRGVHAFMPTGMHRVYTRLYELYSQGERDAARRLFEQVLPVLAFSNQHLDISIHFFKRLLHAQGVYATARVREPILPFDRTHEKIADELIRRVCALEQELA